MDNFGFFIFFCCKVESEKNKYRTVYILSQPHYEAMNDVEKCMKKKTNCVNSSSNLLLASMVCLTVPDLM